MYSENYRLRQHGEPSAFMQDETETETAREPERQEETKIYQSRRDVKKEREEEKGNCMQLSKTMSIVLTNPTSAYLSERILATYLILDDEFVVSLEAVLDHTE